MARIEAGILLLDNGEKIYIENVVLIDSTTISGFVDIYANLYYGNGSNLTGVPRSFLDMTDVPVSYSGSADKYLKVKSDESGVEFGSYVSSGGDYYTTSEITTISGALQAEIDLFEVNNSQYLIKYRGVSTLSSGVDNLDITFSSSLSSSDYTVSACLSNAVHSLPSIYFLGVEEKTSSGFKIRLSGNTNSTDYKLEWTVVSSEPEETTEEIGIFAGGYDSNVNVIDYVTISTIGNATDFGDLTIARGLLGATSNGSNNRGVFGGAQDLINNIDYVTITIPGNAVDFGDLTIDRGYCSATSNSTNERGIFGNGGTLDYITISTIGNAYSFGNTSVSRSYFASTSNGTNNSSY